MDKLLFGDNQFFGVNHMSEEKARQQQMKFQHTDAIIDVLRDALHTASNGMPGEPASACHERAHAIGELFAQCGAAYQSMAEVADRLDSDRRTLIEAWPK